MLIYWLLSDDALQRRLVREIREARTPMVARAVRAGPAESGHQVLTVADGVAQIRVEGVLTPTPDMMAEYYGEPNTTYPELSAALRSALDDPSVSEIEWVIDSPGGSVDGYFSLLEDIADARANGSKPMSATVHQATSAAYGIAAVAGPITAVRRTSVIGSVGVATSGFIQGGLCGEVVEMTNTDAPEKRPNLKTPEGKAVVVKLLDEIAAEFMGAIAQGRGITTDAVASGYGRGSSMLASAALSAGMIDGIADRLDTRKKRGYSAAGMADQTHAADAAAPTATATVVTTPADTLAAVGLNADDAAELAQLRAERQARQDAERRELIGVLVAVGAETPDTAYANGAPVARLAAEPLTDLRARAERLRAARSAAAPVAPPVNPGGQGTGTEADLADFERRDAAKIKDPDARARFVAMRLARKQDQ